MECVTSDCTNPNTNPKTITTLTFTLTDNHDLVKKFLSAIPSRKSAMPASTLYVLKFVSIITRLILILTLYDVNLTLGNAYDAFDKNCRRRPDSNLKTIKRSVPRYEFAYLGCTL